MRVWSRLTARAKANFTPAFTPETLEDQSCKNSSFTPLFYCNENPVARSRGCRDAIGRSLASCLFERTLMEWRCVIWLIRAIEGPLSARTTSWPVATTGLSSRLSLHRCSCDKKSYRSESPNILLFVATGPWLHLCAKSNGKGTNIRTTYMQKLFEQVSQYKSTINKDKKRMYLLRSTWRCIWRLCSERISSLALFFFFLSFQQPDRHLLIATSNRSLSPSFKNHVTVQCPRPNL